MVALITIYDVIPGAPLRPQLNPPPTLEPPTRYIPFGRPPDSLPSAAVHLPNGQQPRVSLHGTVRIELDIEPTCTSSTYARVDDLRQC